MPPKAPGSIFTLKPKSQDVPQGSVAEFVAEVAREDISVRWERDGRDLPPGGRWSVSRTSSRHHVLSVIDVRAEDAAELAVIAGGSRVRFRLQVLKPQPSVEEQQVVGGKVLPLSVNEAEEEVGSAMLEQEGGGNENLCEHRQELTGLFLEKPQNGIVQVGGELGFVARVQSELLSRKPSVRWFKGKWMDLASKVGKHLKLLETFNRNTKVYTFEMRVMDAKESFAGSYRCEVMLKEKFDSWTFELLVEEAPEPKQVMDIRAAFRKVSTTGEDSGELDFSGLLKKREQKVEASEPDEDVWELLKGANPQEYERIAFEHGVTDLRGLLHRLKRMKQEQRKSEVFLKRLDPAYQADKGGRVRLAVDLEDPNTEIKWFKNGTEIRSSGKFIMEAQGKRRILTINHCSLADDAAYEVMVGDEKCSTELFVREPPVHIVRDLDDQSCLVGDRVEFFCEVSEDGAQVKWLKDGKELSREESCKFRFKKDGPKHQLIISDVCQEDNGRYSVVTSGGETHAELHVEEKPLEVIRGMADLTVNARDLAVFRCEVSEERVSGRWYKDGREVRPSEHVCISHVGRIHKLEIDGVRDDDKGDYTFVPDGHAFSLSAKLNMLEVKIDFVPRQEPPKIHLEPLEGLAENTIVVVAGNKLRLDLPISGDPTPTVIWHRGQQVISASQGRVHVESFPDHSTFVVECAERGDEDCYSIVVRNDAGEDSAQLNVKVVDVPDPPSTPSIVVLGGDWCLAEWEPPEWDGGVPLLGYVVERKKKQSYRWMRLNFDPVKQPRFEPRRMIEGATYELRVFAVNAIGTSRPSPPCQPFVLLDPPGEPTGLAVEDVSDESVTLRWKMPEQVGVTGLLGYHVEYHVDGGDEWKEACPGLVARTNVCVSGLPTGAHVIFRVCAVNAAGPGPHGSLFQPVTVRQVVERPRVLLPRDLRQGLTRKVGETVNIVIPFQGKPTPCVLWEKDEQPLDSSAVSVRNGESDSILYIRHCERAHSGLYSLTLRLEQLTDRATIDLQVVERPSPPRAVTVEEVWSSNVSLSWQPPIDDGNAELAGYTVQKADSKSMEWFTVYDRYRRMRCVVSDLILGNAYFFRVFSENVCGLSETACTSKDSAYIQKSGLAYQRPVFQERDPSEPPQFSHSLADVVSVAGYNATLSCCVRGNPKPKVMWLRNGVDISEDPRFRMFTSQGICTLEARKPGPFDGAMFTCHATNTFGEDQTECRLTVRGKFPNRMHNPFGVEPSLTSTCNAMWEMPNMAPPAMRPRHLVPRENPLPLHGVTLNPPLPPFASTFATELLTPEGPYWKMHIHDWKHHLGVQLPSRQGSIFIRACTGIVYQVDIKLPSPLPASVARHQRSHGVLHEEEASHRRHHERITNSCSNIPGGTASAAQVHQQQMV